MCIKIALLNIDETILTAHEAVQANRLNVKDFENYWAGEWNGHVRATNRDCRPRLEHPIRFKGRISLPDLEEKSKYSSSPIYTYSRRTSIIMISGLIRKLFG